ncbi:MAG: dTMP kinase [Desulfobacterales bacterium]|nr:dTMP kinase [Desulfobacterales bacterium]MDD4071031.1 dTMP kinase [Desulfobacterales bacterium]MDD4392427.1 dTMP kinase [Desulfobacterales bacterium]
MFITLEGIEGSGKTTQARHMVDFFQTKGLDCILTREPGGTSIGTQIRSIVLDPASCHMDPATELLLYVADRVQHINELIRPALADGKVVICDRYADATVVYQGFARGLSVELIEQLHQLVLDKITPDMTLLLDLPPETGLARAWKQIHNGSRTHQECRFEQEKLSFHQKVRDGYLKLAHRDPRRFRIIDATATENEIRQEILNEISRLPENCYR